MKKSKTHPRKPRNWKRPIGWRRPKIFKKPQEEKKPQKAQAPAPAVVAKSVPAPKPRRQILFCPGPVNTTLQVKAALAGPDLCHREPEFSELLQTIRAKLVHALGLDGRYSAVILNGSGTAALESAVLAGLEPGRKLLVINNGVYGSRIAQLARLRQMPLVEIRSPLTERPDLNRISAALKRDSHIGTVAMVHHETSTGMLNPVEEVGALTRKYRRKFLVDGISSLGAHPLDLAKQNIGLCVGSSGKCLHSVPGLSFVLVAQEEIARILKLKPSSLYLDLGLHFKTQEAGDPPFTPAVPLFLAFQTALDELNKEGLRMRVARYRQRAVLLRTSFKKLGLKFLLDERFLSNALTSLWVPKGLTYPQLHDRLKKAGYIIYAGQSELKGKIFRVAHMGQLFQGDLQGFIKDLKGILEAAQPPSSS
ncbi:MAG: alanine--glyoxylate aminotransferase family protein [Candidatus Omnitrophica bacterium]|nr:alanine--glyoxylate aminotransferase family protein [Candidatus Omnitrophota bacterium]